MPGGERLDVGPPVGVEGLQLGGEQNGVVAAGPVEGRHADRVAGGHEAAVLTGDHQRERPPEVVEAGDPRVLVDVQCSLVIGPRDELPVVELRSDAVVVVDLAVPDQPQVAGDVAERLVAAFDVDDPQPTVAEPRVADRPRALAVGTAMGQPLSMRWPSRGSNGP